METSQGNVATARGFETQDISSSPQMSPLTVGTAQITLAVPKNAIAFVYQARGADMKISDVDGMVSYLEILDGNGDTLECADISSIYVKGSSSVLSLHFYFKTI